MEEVQSRVKKTFRKKQVNRIVIMIFIEFLSQSPKALKDTDTKLPKRNQSKQKQLKNFLIEICK